MNHEFSDQDFTAVAFQNNLHNRIKIDPMYFKLGFSPVAQIYGRSAVLTRLTEALSFLPKQYGFLIWDVYRPRAVQAVLFNWMRDELRNKSPHLSEEENYNEAKKYMSPPAKVGDEYCSPHLSGGAIDLSLFDVNTGNEIDMGTAFDDCTARAHTNFFDLKKDLLPQEISIKESRELLSSAMKRVGFTAYQYEWWHFDLGNIFWAECVQKPAVFGPLFGDNEWPDLIGDRG